MKLKVKQKKRRQRENHHLVNYLRQLTSAQEINQNDLRRAEPRHCEFKFERKRSSVQNAKYKAPAA